MIKTRVYTVSKNGGSGGGTIYSSGGIVADTAISAKGVTLWGQYHDHTQDIDGDFVSKGKVTAKEVNTNNVVTYNGKIDNLTSYNGNIDTFTSDNSKINTLTATTGTIDTIKSKAITNTGTITTDKIKANYGEILELIGENWTVDNLTVTKAAHFFKLIIDEIKASQGAIIITPGNCVLHHVETLSNGNFRCYFLNKDNNKEVYNNFEVNDQVICQTFNAATGTSYDVSNTYYWRLCVGTGTIGDYHYIDLSDTDKDKYSNSAPKAGDNCVLLGNRSNKTRQAAIIISAYNSGYLDKGIKAPSICQYNGINDYNLDTHRLNVISNGLNSFKGEFYVASGDRYVKNVSILEIQPTNRRLGCVKCEENA